MFLLNSNISSWFKDCQTLTALYLGYFSDTFAASNLTGWRNISLCDKEQVYLLFAVRKQNPLAWCSSPITQPTSCLGIHLGLSAWPLWDLWARNHHRHDVYVTCFAVIKSFVSDLGVSCLPPASMKDCLHLMSSSVLRSTGFKKTYWKYSEVDTNIYFIFEGHKTLKNLRDGRGQGSQIQGKCIAYLIN